MDLPAPDAHTVYRDETPPISAQLKSVNLRNRFSSPLSFHRFTACERALREESVLAKLLAFFSSDLTKTPLADLLSVAHPCPFVGVV